MKKINILFVLFTLIVACKGQNKEQEVVEKEEIAMNYASFGDKIDANNALTASEMTKKYQNLAVTDTLTTKLGCCLTFLRKFVTREANSRLKVLIFSAMFTKKKPQDCATY